MVFLRKPRSQIQFQTIFGMAHDSFTLCEMLENALWVGRTRNS